MTDIEKIKSIDLTSHISKYLWAGKKEATWTRFRSSPEDKTPSLLVYSDTSRWYNDYSWKYGWWTIIDFQMNYFNQTKAQAIKSLKEQYNISDDSKKEFKKSVKREELVKNFETYRMQELNSGFSQFLQTRWISFDNIKENKEVLNEIAKELWFCENQFVDKDTFKDVIIIPSLNENKQTIWGMIRRCDGKKILMWANKLKSVAVWWFPTGILFDKISDKYVLICEWFPDYVILKILWFNSVICNNWWVWANADKIQQIVKKVDKIVCLYDNDLAWQKWTLSLQEKIWRPIRVVKYPKIEWMDKYDINDLFNAWYRKKDFDKLIKDSELLNSEEIKEIEIDELTNIIEKQDGYYFLEYDKKWNPKEVKITNFKIKIEDIILYPNNDTDDIKKSLRLKLYSWSKSVVWEFKSKETTWIWYFSQKIRSLETSFSIYNMQLKNLEELIRYIHKWINIKNTILIDKKWYIPEYKIFIFKNGILHEKKFYEYEYWKVVDIWEYRVKVKADDKNMPKFQEEFYIDNSIKENIINDFRYMFSWLWWDLVLWFLISSLFVNSIRDLKPFPILFIAWKKWSWKTTALECALKVLWLEMNAENFEDTSNFMDQLEISELISFPLWRDEYKNVNKVKLKDWFLKSVFDRNGISKWTIINDILWKITYPINASLILSWEESPNDDAVFSRVCLIDVNWNREWGANEFERIKIRSDYYWSILKELLESNDFDNLTNQYREIFIGLKKFCIENLKLEKRILNVYLPVISWFVFFNKHILNKNMFSDKQIKEEWILSILETIKQKQKEEIEQDIINDFFDVINNLLMEWKISYSEQYIKSFWENGCQLAFNYLYWLYKEKEIRLQGRQINKLNLKKYMLSEFGAYESIMKTYWGKTQRSLVFTDKMPDNLKIIMDNYLVDSKSNYNNL